MQLLTLFPTLLILTTPILSMPQASGATVPKSPATLPHPSIAIGASCAGASQKKVMWWTTNAADASASAVDDTISSVSDAVISAGGQVVSTINIGKMKGLTLIAPAKVLDMVQQLVGKDLGFQMENDGVASIA